MTIILVPKFSQSWQCQRSSSQRWAPQWFPGQSRRPSPPPEEGDEDGDDDGDDDDDDGDDDGVDEGDDDGDDYNVNVDDPHGGGEDVKLDHVHEDHVRTWASWRHLVALERRWLNLRIFGKKAEHDQ